MAIGEMNHDDPGGGDKDEGFRAWKAETRSRVRKPHWYACGMRLSRFSSATLKFRYWQRREEKRREEKKGQE